MRLMGIFGGTFNPIHHGHLRLAQALAENLSLNEVRFIPAANPPHKTAPLVSATQRASMVQLAIAHNPCFTLDTRELSRSGASYTIDTLISLYNEFNDAALCLMMGSDAFVQLDTWHRWQELLDFCHIILVQRPHQTNTNSWTPALSYLMQQHYNEDTGALSQQRSGLITMQNVNALNISSSHIRQLIQHGKQPSYLLPEAVLAYIEQHQLYRSP